MKALSLLALPLLFCACATSSTLAPTTLNPGSVGHVAARETSNGNTNVTVSLQHLPPPAAVNPALNTYVVWLRPVDGGGPYTNIGQVQIGSDRSATLSTVTPYD